MALTSNLGNSDGLLERQVCHFSYFQVIWFNDKHWMSFDHAGAANSRRGTIVFLHGAPTQSYSYRVVMNEVLLN